VKGASSLLLLAGAAVFAPPASARLLLAVTSSNELYVFDSATPQNTSLVALVSGLPALTTITDIDFRPTTGQLYALAYTNVADASTPDELRLYRIDLSTGAATAIGSSFVLTFGDGLVGNRITNNGSFGFAFGNDVNKIDLILNGTGLTPSRSMQLDADTGAAVGSIVTMTSDDFYPALELYIDPSGFLVPSDYGWDFNANTFGFFANGVFYPSGPSGITLDAGLASAQKVGLTGDISGVFFVGQQGGQMKLWAPEVQGGNASSHFLGTFSIPTIRDVAIPPPTVPFPIFNDGFE